MSTIADPPLAAAGERRAERLAQMFGDVKGLGGIDAIYVTDTKRAQQTAAGLASRLGTEADRDCRGRMSTASPSAFCGTIAADARSSSATATPCRRSCAS